jgi:hypothetical protein
MNLPVATRPAAQAAVKAVQPVGIDHFIKARREKPNLLSGGAAAAGSDAPALDASLLTGSVTQHLHGKQRNLTEVAVF